MVNHSKKQLQISNSINIRKELELADASFTPEINKISDMIFQKKHDPNLPCYERLVKLGSEAQAKKERVRKLRKEVEENCYDFRPKLSMISRIINDEKGKLNNSKEIPRYELLYEDSKSPLQELAMNQNCTFHPAINEKSLKMLTPEEESFMKRLATSIEKKQTQYQQHLQRLQNPYQDRVKIRMTRSKSPITRTAKVT